MGMYILWLHGSKKEGRIMKKLLAIVTLITLCIISSSCFGSSTKEDKYDPTYYGETYGPMEIINGLQVCLRTDGYYQVIGITDEAVHNGVVVIPQHINGIPVMGLGIPLHESYPAVGFLVPPISYIARVIYQEKKNIPLEKYRNGHMVDRDVNLGYLFSETFLNNRINKIYMSCHHMNENPYTINSNVRDAYIAEDTDFLLIHNYEIANNNEFNEVEEDDYLDYLMPSYFVINQYQYNEFLLNVDKYLLHYAEKIHFVDEEDKNTKIEAEKQRVIGLFKEKISNVEFHYNITIDGVQYHNENNFCNDLYWIDYLNDGDLLMEPLAPYIEGYDFLGWYQDIECTMPYSFNTPVQKVEDELVWLTLYAKWQKQ